MNIEKHIAQLLYRYQCVTVPGFGAFITNISSAEVNAFTQTFSPPRKNISFNSHLKNNDGLLVNYIATIEKITYESATLVVDNVIEKWLQTLRNQGVLTLTSVGSIQLNADGAAVFESTQETNFLASSFGLSSYVSPVIKREIEHLLESKAIYVEEPKVVLLEHADHTNQKPYYLKYAAAAIIAFGTLGYVGSTFYNQQIEAQNEITQREVQKEVNQKIQEATFFISNPLQYKKESITDVEKDFHIVAGSFRSQRNVNNLLRRMTKLGYNPKALAKDSNGVSQVLFGSYPTFRDAQIELEKIHTSENPEAWILIKKL